MFSLCIWYKKCYILHTHCSTNVWRIVSCAPHVPCVHHSAQDLFRKSDYRVTQIFAKCMCSIPRIKTTCIDTKATNTQFQRCLIINRCSFHLHVLFTLMTTLRVTYKKNSSSKPVITHFLRNHWCTNCILAVRHPEGGHERHLCKCALVAYGMDKIIQKLCCPVGCLSPYVPHMCPFSP